MWKTFSKSQALFCASSFFFVHQHLCLISTDFQRDSICKEGSVQARGMMTCKHKDGFLEQSRSKFNGIWRRTPCLCVSVTPPAAAQAQADVAWHGCQSSAPVVLLLSDFVSHPGSCLCWFTAPSLSPWRKLHLLTASSVRQQPCQLPLLWFLNLMMTLITVDDWNAGEL